MGGGGGGGKRKKVLTEERKREEKQKKETSSGIDRGKAGEERRSKARVTIPEWVNEGG